MIKINDKLEEMLLFLFCKYSQKIPLTLTLENVCDFQEGYVNPSQEVSEYFNGNIKWLRGIDFTSQIIINTSRTITKQGFASAGKSALLFSPNTIVITKSGTIGKISIIADYMCGNRATINIAPKNNSFLPYVYCLLKTMQSKFHDMAVGSVQRNLYVSALRKIQCHKIDDSWNNFLRIGNIIIEELIKNAKEKSLLQQIQRAFFGNGNY